MPDPLPSPPTAAPGARSPLARRARLAALALLVVGAAGAACGRDAPAPAKDTSVAVPPPIDSAPPVPDAQAEQAALWASLGAGELIALPALGSDRARVLRPPAPAEWQPTPEDTFAVDLLRPGGTATPARLVGTDGSSWGDCAPGEAVRVVAEGALPAWTVAFARGAVRPLALDSLPALSSRDSATRVRDVTRVVSALEDDTAEAFRRVPFAVRVAHHFTWGRGWEGIVAEVRRRIGQEARPREERTLVIMERAPGGRWQEVFHDRLDGEEDVIAAWQVLAVVQLGPGTDRPAAVIGYDGNDGIAVDVVARRDAGRWTRQWSSGVECAAP